MADKHRTLVLCKSWSTLNDMNLQNLAYTIGQRIGLVQNNDLIACKAFLQVRYDQLWRSFLWRDSLIEYVLPIDPAATYLPTSNYLPTKGHLILPPIFGQVIACRTNANSMNVQRPMLYYRMSQDEFTKGGSPLEFYLLSAAVWELDTFQNTCATDSNGADVGQPFTVDFGASDGVSINRSVLKFVTDSQWASSATIAKTDLIASLTKPVTAGSVLLQVYGFPVTTVVNSSANSVDFTFTDSNGVVIPFTLTAGQTKVLSTAVSAYTFNDVVGGHSNSATFSLLGGTFTYAGGTDLVLVLVYYPIATLQATDTDAPKCQRIRFVSIPNAATIVRVLGKRITPPLSADSDSPVINGMDGVLFGLGYYDMCARKNSQGTPEAQAALTEAVGPEFLTRGVPGGFLGKLIEEEVIQAASNTRIIPEGGFGDTGGNFGSWATKASPY